MEQMCTILLYRLHNTYPLVMKGDPPSACGSAVDVLVWAGMAWLGRTKCCLLTWVTRLCVCVICYSGSEDRKVALIVSVVDMWVIWYGTGSEQSKTSYGCPMNLTQIYTHTYTYLRKHQWWCCPTPPVCAHSACGSLCIGVRASYTQRDYL